MNGTVFRLSVPASPASVRVIRSVASAAAAEAALAYDSFDDLGLAIDEASGALLEHGGVSLHCSVDDSDHGLAVVLSITPDPGERRQWPDQGWQESLGALVLSTVAADVAYGEVAGRPAVSFNIG